MRSTRKEMFLKVLSMVTVLAIMVGCSGGAKAPATPDPATPTPPVDAKKNLDVTIAMWSPPNNFSPINTDSSYGYFNVEILFDTLVRLNDKAEFVPKLAEKWDVSPDFTTFTFHINPKAKWHDGTPVTAKDVVFTVNTIANKETVSNRGAYISLIKGTDASGKSDGPVEGITAVNDKTVEITAKAPVDALSFLEKFGANIFILPEHVLGSVAPKDLTAHPFFLDPKVGNGPFKFVRYNTDQFVEFTRNEDYYLGTPKVERVFVRIMQANTAVAALEKGEVDITAGAGIGEIPITDWDKVQGLANVNAVSFVSRGYQYFDFNHTRPFFENPKVREAFYYGINRKLIVDNLLQGTGVVLEQPYTPIFAYQNEALQTREFDVAKAKQLLTEGGWDFNREITLLVPLGNRVREQSADIIMANLQQVGIKIKAQKMDFPTMQSFRTKQDYDVSLVGWSSLMDPDVSSQYRTEGVYNNGKYSNPKVDALLDKGAVTADFNARKAIYDEFTETIYSNPNVVFLYSPNALTAVSGRMQNVKMAANGFLWNMQDWDVTK
jgi:peptide/nickel transport system substrate-binding protein